MAALQCVNPLIFKIVVCCEPTGKGYS